MKNQDIKKLSEYILELAPTVSRELKRVYWEMKKNPSNRYQDVSTRLDKTAGDLWAKNILKRFKNVRIDSEERRDCGGRGEIIVRMDPVDGSKHVRCGLDLAASAISVSFEKKVFFGLVVNPFSEKIYWAYRGKGTFLNGKKIKTNQEGIEASFTMCSFPKSQLFKGDSREFSLRFKSFEEIIKAGFRCRNIGLTTLSVCWVAEGATSAYVDLSGTTKLYDLEAALLIAQEAGAKASDLKGNSITSDSLADLPKSNDLKKHLGIGVVVAGPKAFGQINKILRNTYKR